MNMRPWDGVHRDLDELVDAGLDATSFCAAAGTLVSRVVPCGTNESEAPTWYSMDPGSCLITAAFGPDCEMDAAAQMCWEYVDDDVNKSIDVLRNPRGVQTLHEVTGGQPWLSPIYRDYMYDHGLAQEMLVALRGTDGRPWGTMRLNRPRTMAAFDESDRDFMRLTAPRLADGIRRGLLAAARNEAFPVPAGPGLVVVDNHGNAATVSDHARDWLALFPGDSTGELPLPIHSAACATRGRKDDPAVLHVRLSNGCWAVLHGVRNEPGTVSVIISSPDAGGLLPVASAIYGLSQREQQVVQLVMRGHPTHRIARLLGISPYTAQEHLRHIFAKAGVGSRGELIAELFLTGS